MLKALRDERRGARKSSSEAEALTAEPPDAEAETPGAMSLRSAQTMRAFGRRTTAISNNATD
jgi:hypothetical protein